MNIRVPSPRRRMPARVSMMSKVRLAAWATCSLISVAAFAQTLPTGPNAATQGMFANAANWPVIPIHAALLADGRVMSYGTTVNTNGAYKQGALIYDIWDPKDGLGIGLEKHLTLPNGVSTDVFCSAQTMLQNGTMFFAGGDTTKKVDGEDKRNFSTDAITRFVSLWRGMFDLTPPDRLTAERWYPSVLTLSNGETLVLGGLYRPREVPATPPELPNPAYPDLYSPEKGLRSMRLGPLNTYEAAFGKFNWTYPRAWQAPNGKVFVIAASGATFYLDAAGTGAITQTSGSLLPGNAYLPSVMYAPGKILSIRSGNRAEVVDLNTTNAFNGAPSAVPAPAPGQDRYHGSTTVMADGKVLYSGGASIYYESGRTDFIDQLGTIGLTARIWDPKQSPLESTWTTAATAKSLRVYHSISMLLPDGTVLTGGGGAPGPSPRVLPEPNGLSGVNPTVEIYYPPYLYKADNTPATRPVVTEAPQAISWNSGFTVKSNAPISRVTLVRFGSVTHTVDFDQRFINLDLSTATTGSTRTAFAPANANLAPPGMYMMFVFDAANVPSVAKLVYVGKVDATPPYRTALKPKAWAAQGGYWDAQRWVSGDFDGNKLADAAKVFDCGNGTTTCIDVHLSDGSGTAIKGWGRGINRTFDPNRQWLAGDFDGNGQTDIAEVYDCGNGQGCIGIYSSVGTSITYRQWAANQGGFWANQRWVAGDFNGDGKTDLAKAFASDGTASPSANVDVHLSTGTSFTWSRWANLQGPFTTAQKWLAGDFNADGRSDLAVVYNDGTGQSSIDVLASSGSNSLIRSPWATKQLGFWDAQKWVAGDFNGDGITDLAKVFSENGASVDVHYSTKKSFQYTRLETGPTPYADIQRWLPGDFTGDGKADLAKVSNNGAGQISIEVHR